MAMKFRSYVIMLAVIGFALALSGWIMNLGGQVNYVIGSAMAIGSIMALIGWLIRVYQILWAHKK